MPIPFVSVDDGLVAFHIRDSFSLLQLLHFIPCVAEHPDSTVRACQVSSAEDKERGHFLDGFDDGGPPFELSS